MEMYGVIFKCIFNVITDNTMILVSYSMKVSALLHKPGTKPKSGERHAESVQSSPTFSANLHSRS